MAKLMNDQVKKFHQKHATFSKNSKWAKAAVTNHKE
jgi:hypothetical protein